MLALAALLLALPSCRSTDPTCAGHTAAEFTPTTARYRAMSEGERREEALRFNELARRCGWEP